MWPYSDLSVCILFTCTKRYRKWPLYKPHTVRAYLKFRGIDFKDVEVNPLTKNELKANIPGYTKVPVVIIKDHNDNVEAGKSF